MEFLQFYLRAFPSSRATYFYRFAVVLAVKRVEKLRKTNHQIYSKIVTQRALSYNIYRPPGSRHSILSLLAHLASIILH